MLADPRFQDRYLTRLNDLPSLRRDLEQAVRASAVDHDADGYRLAAEAGLNAVSFLRDRLRPERIFALARAGDLEAAERELGLFVLEPEWRQAVLLTAAWLAVRGESSVAHSAVASRTEAARRMRDRLRAELPTDGPLPLLVRHLDAILDGAALVLPPLPPAPSHRRVWEMIQRLMGPRSPDDASLMASGLDPHGRVALAEGAELSADSEPVYVAEQDAPWLVAHVASGDPMAARQFADYASIHASNAYVRYRNRSLGFLLEASLRRADQAWALDTATHLVAATLASGRPEFQESLPLALRGLQARGSVTVRRELDTLRDRTLKEADRLHPGRELSDPWGTCKRRLAALAQAYFVLDDTDSALRLLRQATRVPFGFAGFQTTACLALIDAVQVCRQDVSDPDDLLELPRIAAHNIQDPVFCAQMTARARAIEQLRAHAPVGYGLLAMISRFVAGHTAVEFAPTHVVQDDYSFRSPGPRSIPLPSSLTDANTLRQLATAYRRPLEEFSRLNRQSGWDPDEPLPRGTLVPVPDPEFPAWLSAHFAAQVAAGDGFSVEEGVRSIQSLVPYGAAHGASLDAVLARLVIVARPVDPGLLGALTTIATRALEPPAGSATDTAQGEALRRSLLNDYPR